MKFLFKAKNDAGQMSEGVVEAISWEAAAQVLGKNGLTPITIKQQKNAQAFLQSFHKILEGVKQKDLMVFFRQLATLIDARVPVASSLNTIEEEFDNKYFRMVIREIADDVEDGMPFSEALEKHRDIFSPLTINMIRAGEISGSLQKSISFVAGNIDKNYQLTSRIKSALYYPVFVLGVAFIVGFLVISFILPRISSLIRDSNVSIPWHTSLLISVGDFMSQYWWAVAFVILAAIGSFIYYLRTPAGRSEWSVLVLRIPVIGQLARNIYVARFAENLSALLNSGIPVVRALTIVSEVVGNSVFEGIILKAANEVKNGNLMSAVFVHYPEMPSLVAQMTRIGEETGTLARVLKGTAEFYNQEVDTMTKNLTALIEPVLIVGLGIGVGFLVVSILLPIYTIAGQL